MIKRFYEISVSVSVFVDVEYILWYSANENYFIFKGILCRENVKTQHFLFGTNHVIAHTGHG